MKKLLLIMFLASAVMGAERVWISTDSTDMNLATNYSGSGPILETDTLIFNGTSVVNATATANLSVAHVEIQSTYSGNWVMTGYSLTLNNGGLLRSGSGTFTLGTTLTLNGNGKLYTNATSGTNTTTSCVITFNGNDTVDINKALTTRGIVINGTVTNVGSVFFITEATPFTETDQPFYIGPAGVYTGTGSLQIRSNKDCLAISKHPTGVFNATGEISIMSTNTKGNITICVPAIDIPSNLVMSCVWGGALATFDLQGNIKCDTLEMRVSTLNVSPLTFNTNGNRITANAVNIGTQKAGVKCYVNFGNSTVYTNTFTTQKHQADSTILTCDGTVFDYVTWNHGTYERIDGTYTKAPPRMASGTDTLKLNAKHFGTTQWLQNGSVIASGSSISLNADSAFYAGTKIEAVTGSKKSTWQFKSSGNKRSINFK